MLIGYPLSYLEILCRKALSHGELKIEPIVSFAHRLAQDSGRPHGCKVFRRGREGTHFFKPIPQMLLAAKFSCVRLVERNIHELAKGQCQRCY